MKTLILLQKQYLGMLALCLSSFSPTARFGCLMAAQMVASLLGELVFLPALLSLRPNRKAAVAAPPAAVKEEPEPQIVPMPVMRPHFATGTRSKVANH